MHPVALIPSAHLALPSGDTVVVTVGDIIGRSRTASVHIDDPRVSIAHAMVDVRSGRACLLRLRRSLYVDGREVSSVILKPGIRIGLCPDNELTLTVQEVQIPTHVLTLEGVLPSGIDLSRDLVIHSTPELDHPLSVHSQHYAPGALAYVYSGGDGTWNIHIRGASPEPLFDGWQGELAGLPVRARARPLLDTSALPTASTYRRLRITARYESVTIDDGARRVFVISGLPARILSEVIECGGGPILKKDIAEQIWNTPADRDLDEQTLCARLDRHIGILRAKLQAAGLPPDLLTRDGTGHLELKLGPHDIAHIDDDPISSGTAHRL